MAGRYAGQIYSALLSKGFRLEGTGRGPHRRLVLFVGGARTSVWTVLSRDDRKVYQGGLLTSVKSQLGLETSQQVRDLVDCPLDHDDYVDILLQAGRISL